MQLETLQKKKQIFHVLNTIITLVIMALSGLSIYIALQSEKDKAGALFGILSCVFAGMALILGALLPPKEKNVYLSDRTKQAVVLADVILNDDCPSPSIMDRKQLYRSWNYTGMVILGVFMIIFNAMSAMIAVINEYSAAACIALVIFWLLLDVGAGFWTYYDAVCTGIEEGRIPIECKEKTIRYLVKSTVITVVILCVAAIASHFMTEAQHKPAVDTGKIHQEISEMVDKVNQLEPDDFFANEEYDSATKAVLSLKKNYGDTKYYYILKYNDSNGLNIISWTDESDQVCVDSFECREDGSVVSTLSFVSDAITKADVAGKQDGVVE